MCTKLGSSAQNIEKVLFHLFWPRQDFLKMEQQLHHTLLLFTMRPQKSFVISSVSTCTTDYISEAQGIWPIQLYGYKVWIILSS